MSDDEIQGFGSDIAGTVSIVYCDTPNKLWIPYEFIGDEPATRLLLVGEHNSGTRALVASEKWTAVFDMNGAGGARMWSVLASTMKHMIGPMLIVVAADLSIPPAFFQFAGAATIIVFRWETDTNPVAAQVKSLFFPLRVTAGHIINSQRAYWKGNGLRTPDTNLAYVLNETKPQGLHLVSSVIENGTVALGWYRPKDSDDIVVVDRRDSAASWLGAISDLIIDFMKR